MAFSIIVNGVTYTEADFTGANYAQSFERMVGDGYEESFRKWAMPITLTSPTTFTTVNYDSLATNYSSFEVGSYVILCPSADRTKRYYGKITGSTPGSPWTFTVARQAGLSNPYGMPDKNWLCLPIGVLENPSDPVLAQTKGGTGSSTAAGARTNLSFPVPATDSQVIEDDFIGYSMASNTRGYFAASGNTYCLAAHNDKRVLERFPEINLASHPGMAQQYVSAEGDNSLLAGHFNSKPLVSNFVFSSGENSFEWLMTYGGPDISVGGFQHTVGMCNTPGMLTPLEFQVIGVGIRPTGQVVPDIENIFRLYSVSSGAFYPATVGPISKHVLIPNMWYRVCIRRTGTGNVKAKLYGMDQRGNVFYEGYLGEILAANVPSAALVPYSNLTKFENLSFSYIEVLSDYCRMWKKVTR